MPKDYNPTPEQFESDAAAFDDADALTAALRKAVNTAKTYAAIMEDPEGASERMNLTGEALSALFKTCCEDQRDAEAEIHRLLESLVDLKPGMSPDARAGLANEVPNWRLTMRETQMWKARSRAAAEAAVAEDNRQKGRGREPGTQMSGNTPAGHQRGDSNTAGYGVSVRGHMSKVFTVGRPGAQPPKRT